MLCCTLDGQLKETHIDQQLLEIYAPVVDDCYALAEKDGLIYMLYYSYTVIAAFDETDVRRVWIVSDKEKLQCLTDSGERIIWFEYDVAEIYMVGGN
nr:hypothetical protein P5629_04860 [Bacillus subtilis]